MEKIIGIDIDNTLCFYDSALYDWLSKKNKQYCESKTKSKEISLDDINEYLTKSISTKTLKAFQPKSYLAYPNAIETINYLHNCGYKIYFISSRPAIKPIVTLTTQWLQQNNIPYDKLVLRCKNKPEYAKNLGVQIFIDDNEKYAKGFLENHIIPLIFNDNKNQSQKALNEKAPSTNYQIFNNWQDIKNYFIKNFEKTM